MTKITWMSTLVVTAAALCVTGLSQAAEQWLSIGHANNTVDVTAADGRLFAATNDNKLWVREIRHKDTNWQHIGHANNVAALATANGRLYAATRDNKLWVRSTASQDVPWAYVGHANNVRAMTGVGTRLYAATTDNRLWSKDTLSTKSDWQPVGHANDVIAMASIDNTLYAVSKDNLLWSRQASLTELDWTRIGTAENVLGLAGYGGQLYATTTGNRLLVMTPTESGADMPPVRDMKSDAPMPKARIDHPPISQKAAPATKSSGTGAISAVDTGLIRETKLKLDHFSIGQVAEAINVRGSRSYQYLIMNGRSSKSGDSSQQILGLLLMRNTDAMMPLGAGLFDDGQGNLVSSGNIASWRKERIAYTVTMTPWGENVFAADRNADGVVDVAVGSRSRDRLWLMGQNDIEWLRICFEQSDVVAMAGGEIQAAALCTQCLSPERPAGPLTVEEQGCLKDHAGQGGGAFGAGGPFGSAVTGAASFLEPNCGAQRPGEGLASNWYYEQAQQHRQQSNAFEAVASVARATGEGNTASAAGVLADLHRQAAEAYASAFEHEKKSLRLWRMGNREGAEEVRNQTHRDYTRARKIENRIYEAEAGYAAAATTLETGEVHNPEDVYPPRNPSGPDPGGSSQPGIGPDGLPEMAFEDPRCGSSSSAFWEICGKADTNIMDCSRNLGDSAYALTGGQCRTEIGPNDEEIVVCYGQRVDAGSRDPGDGRPSTGGGTSGIAEGRLPRTGGGAAGQMIDYTPLGGFILALCSRGGCPDAAMRDTGERSP
jgi:hypothetical protein